MLRITSLGVRVLHPMNSDSLTAASVSDVGRIAEVQIINATSKASLKTDLTQPSRLQKPAPCYSHVSVQPEAS